MNPIRVFVVDDHPIMHIGVCAIIDAQPDVTVVGQTSTSECHLALD